MTTSLHRSALGADSTTLDPPHKPTSSSSTPVLCLFIPIILIPVSSYLYFHTCLFQALHPLHWTCPTCQPHHPLTSYIPVPTLLSYYMLLPSVSLLPTYYLTNQMSCFPHLTYYLSSPPILWQAPQAHIFSSNSSFCVSRECGHNHSLCNISHIFAMCICAMYILQCAQDKFCTTRGCSE